MTIEENINNYIKKSSESKIRTRAKGIPILDIQELSKDPLITSFRIKGSGGIYTVSVKNYDNAKISSKCSCPYNWGGICKHEVAALRTLVANQSLTKISPEKKKSNTKNGVFKLQLNNDGTINAKALDQLRPARLETFSNIEVTTSTLKFDNIVAEYKATVGKFFYEKENKKYEITTKKVKNQLEITCSCNQYDFNLCHHQHSFMRSLVSSFGKSLFKSNDALAIKKKERIIDLGLNLTEQQIDEYFEFNLVKNIFKAKSKTKGFGKYSNPSAWKNVITQRFKNEDITASKLFQQDAQLLSNENKDTFGFAFGLMLESNYLYLDLLKGKVNKTGELSSKITKIESLNDFKYVTTISNQEKEKIYVKTRALNTEEVNEIASSYYDWRSENSAGDLKMTNYCLSELRKIVPLLKKYPLYLIKGHLIKKNLEEIELYEESSTLSFQLNEANEFYNLGAYINVAGNKKKLTANSKNITPLFYTDTNKYYLHQSAEYATQLLFFKENPVIKIFKDDFQEFYNEFLVPLQKNYHVDIKIKDLFKRKKQKKDLKVKKKVYISEMNTFVIFKPIVEYPQGEVELQNEEPLQQIKNGKITEYNRDEKIENDFKSIFTALHPNFDLQKERQLFYLYFDEMMKDGWFFDAFEKLKENDIEVYGLNDLKSFNFNPHKPVITTSVKSGIDWFEVDLSVAFGDNLVAVKDLKKAIIKKEKYIKLGDGTQGIIPEDWIKKYERLFRTGKVKGDKLEVPKLLFSVVDELFENMEGSEDVLKEITEKKKKLKSFTKIKNIKQPKGIEAKLRDYQLSGISWLNFLEEFSWGGCLADDMGLGKTIQIISFFKYLKDKSKVKKRKTNLVVVPTSLIFNWQDEMDKFCPTLKYKVVYGTNRDKSIDDFGDYDVILTSYGVLMNDIETLKKYKFNYAILDESQAIKNPTSKRYKATRLIKSKNRVALTGTPIENNTFDLYSQMTFLNPGLFGTPADFKKNYSEPIDKNKDIERAKELQQIISPFLLRRTKEQVATELPPKTESVLYCEMGKEQRKVYDAYRNKYRDYLLGKIEDDGLGKSKMYVLEGLTKLRQICDSPVLIKDEDIKTNESTKIKELINTVTEKTGQHKILIFSQFVTMLELIKAELETNEIQYEYLTGQTRNRQEKVENFQNNDDVRVFLISLKAGGTGLNLTAADYVYIVDPWWNPAVEAQAIDRCYRIGQDKSVMAYKMICKDTIEEKIIEYQKSKKKLASDIIKTDDSFVKSLTKNDIKDLFS